MEPVLTGSPCFRRGSGEEDSPKHVFLRNEPTVLASRFLSITFICRRLCRLQILFAGGFVFENEPTGRGYLGSVSSKSGFVSGERSQFWVLARGQKDARQRVPTGAICKVRQTWQARTAGPAVPTGGEMREGESGVFFLGSSFRILVMKVAG